VYIDGQDYLTSEIGYLPSYPSKSAKLGDDARKILAQPTFKLDLFQNTLSNPRGLSKSADSVGKNAIILREKGNGPWNFAANAPCNYPSLVKLLMFDAVTFFQGALDCDPGWLRPSETDDEVRKVMTPVQGGPGNPASSIYFLLTALRRRTGWLLCRADRLPVAGDRVVS